MLRGIDNKKLRNHNYVICMIGARYLNVALCVKSLRQRKFIMKIIINLLFLISISSITFGQKAIKLNAHLQYVSSDFAIHKYNTNGTVRSIEESNLSFFPSPTLSFFY